MTLNVRRLKGLHAHQHRVRVLQEAEQLGLLVFERSYHGNAGNSWHYLVAPRSVVVTVAPAADPVADPDEEIEEAQPPVIETVVIGPSRSLAAIEVIPYVIGMADARQMTVSLLEADEQAVISGEATATVSWLDANACTECHQYPSHKMDCSRARTRA